MSRRLDRGRLGDGNGGGGDVGAGGGTTAVSGMPRFYDTSAKVQRPVSVRPSSTTTAHREHHDPGQVPNAIPGLHRHRRFPESAGAGLAESSLSGV